MAAELGLLSLTQLGKLAQSQQNQNQQQQQQQHRHRHRHRHPNHNLNLMSGSWMWNPKGQSQEDDDSWEVRAFAEDTGNEMGTTWPPRSYTCTFCRREFRSAQALGGHMNVHRRDRARLHHQTHPGGVGDSFVGAFINPTTSSISSSITATTSSSTLLIPTQEFATNGGLCVLYQLPSSSNGVFTSPPINACSIDSPSTLLSISPFPPPSNHLMAAAAAPPPSLNFPVTTSELVQPSASSSADNNLNVDANNISSTSNLRETFLEELDLELRLGHKPTTS